MKNLLFTICIFLSINSFAQCIHTDIFDDLEFTSHNREYKANLKENIFHDLIFTDSNGNKVTMKEDYLHLKYKGIHRSKGRKEDFFLDLIHDHRTTHHHVASFDVDIFDRIVIEDNHKNVRNPGHRHHPRLLVLEYNIRYAHATMKQEGYNSWFYSDSSGNEIKISPNAWRKFIRKHRTKEEVFHHLVHLFLEG